MQRAFTVLAIALAIALLLGIGIALAQNEPPKDEAATATVEGGGALELPGETPVEVAGGCQAFFDCDDGTTRQCTGSTTCTVLSNGVECDGNQNLCASGTGSCSAKTNCSQCSATVSCTSSSGDCQVFEGSGVRCDDTYKFCFGLCGPEIPPDP